MYSLVTKVTCFTAWQNGDKRKKNAVLLPVKYFVPPWKGAKSSRNVEVALSPWIANELFFFNRIICSHNYRFRLEKKKKKRCKNSPDASALPCWCVWAAPIWPEHHGSWDRVVQKNQAGMFPIPRGKRLVPSCVVWKHDGGVSNTEPFLSTATLCPWSWC